MNKIMEKSKVKDYIIFDTDMGHMNDDTLALSLLLSAGARTDLEIAGITLEGGNDFVLAGYDNFGTEQLSVFENVRRFLQKCGRTEIPVYPGTDFPAGYNAENILELAGWYKNVNYIQGESEYGAIHFFEDLKSGQLCEDTAAVDFLVDTVRRHPGSVVIFAIGPFMNIAGAIEKDPSFAENVKAIYYMGGAFGEGERVMTVKGSAVQAVRGANVTPYTEYNVLYDPASFYKCVTSGFKKQYICPADLNVSVNINLVEKLRACNAESAAFADIWLEEYSTHIRELPYWDPTTVYAYLRPDRISACSERYITVNTDRSCERFGETTAIPAEVYEKLSDNGKAEYGKAVIVEKLDGFWEYCIPALCGKI